MSKPIAERYEFDFDGESAGGGVSGRIASLRGR
jgi:hypothetical protein